jgi:hypothetical protein
MRRDLKPVLNSLATYEICFVNQFHIKNIDGFNIKSSGFYINGIEDPVYLSDVPDVNGITGIINIFRLDSADRYKIVVANAGTINYTKGEVNLDAINILETVINEGEPIIEISAIPESNDIIGLQDLYLNLSINDVSLEVLADKISSGDDPSGSTYTKTTSYSNGSIIRE